MHQIVCRLGLPPDPTGGAYSAFTDPLAVFRAPTSKGRGGRGRERREGKKRGKEGRGMEKKRAERTGRDGSVGEGRGGSSSFALGRKKVGANADLHWSYSLAYT